jgi:hypothetical protein
MTGETEMTLLKVALAGLVVLTMADHAIALVLTSAPFPSAFTSSGQAMCVVTNGSTTTTNSAVVVMRSINGWSCRPMDRST